MAGSDSVNVLRGQQAARHSHRRFTHTTLTRSWPKPISAGRVTTCSRTCSDAVLHTGHMRAAGSAVTNHTVRPLPGSSLTSAPSSAKAATPYLDAHARGSLVIMLPWKEP